MLEDYREIMQALSGLLKWTQGFGAEMSQLTQQSFLVHKEVARPTGEERIPGRGMAQSKA